MKKELKTDDAAARKLADQLSDRVAARTISLSSLRQRRYERTAPIANAKNPVRG